MSPDASASSIPPVERPADLPVIELVAPLAGFDGVGRFLLVRLDDEGLLNELRSVDHPGLRFVAVPAAPFFPDYAPEIDDEWAARLELTSAEDAIVLVFVTVGEKVTEATANLRAPFIVNRHTLCAAQVVLVGDQYDLRQPLRPAA